MKDFSSITQTDFMPSPEQCCNFVGFGSGIHFYFIYIDKFECNKSDNLHKNLHNFVAIYMAEFPIR